jgi:hypothetical protein
MVLERMPLLGRGHALEAALHHEAGDAALDLGVDQEHVSVGGVGDERLATVEDVVVTVASSGGRHADDVGAHRGLGHAHAADGLAADHIGEISLALLVIRRVVEVVHEQNRMREVREREACVALRELVMDQHRSGDVHACAAGVGRHRDPEQAEVAALAHEVDVERGATVELLSLRLHHVVDEVAHHLAQQMVFLAGVLELEQGRFFHGPIRLTPRAGDEKSCCVTEWSHCRQGFATAALLQQRVPSE